MPTSRLTPPGSNCSAGLCGAGWNLLLSGGTGAGKTTLLNVLAGEVPAKERIVTIEETAELALGQPHVVRLEARPPNAEGAGAVPVRALVRAALRLRPDRLIVGEVRGEEAFDLLQALNTGHCGSLCTIHANGPADALARLESLVLLAGLGPSRRSHPGPDPLLDRRRRPRRPAAPTATGRSRRSPNWRARRPPHASTRRRARPGCPHAPGPPSPSRRMLAHRRRACGPVTAASALERRDRRAPTARAALVAALPDVLERVAGGLRAGAAPLRRWPRRPAAPTCPSALAADLALVVQRAEEGGLAAALDRWAGERPLPAVAAVAAALEVAMGAGGPAAPALEGLAAGLRDRHDAAGEVAALSAQARLSAIVVGAAPLVSLALSLLVDPRVAPTLIGTAPGRACLLAGIALEGLAGLWMRRIVRCEP